MSQPDQDTAASKSSRRPALRLFIQLGLLLAVSGLIVSMGESYKDQLDRFLPEQRLLASTYNKKPSGLSGLLTLTQNMGHPVDTWELSYRRLHSIKGMLVLIAPVQSLESFEIEQIMDWVSEGNDLVYLDNFSIGLTRHVLKTVGMSVRSQVAELNESELPIDGDNPILSMVDSVTVSAGLRLIGGEALIKDNQGAVLALARHGNGRIFLGSCPTLLNNAYIANSSFRGNFQLIENIFSTANGTIYFDEKSHGFSKGTNVFLYLSRSQAGPVTAQILLIVLIAFISESQRFGKARSLDSKRKISNLEFINGLANAYKRARANTAVLDILFSSFKNKLSREIGVSPHESSEKLIDAWEGSERKKEADMRQLIADYERVMKERDVSDEDLKSIMTTCDKITTSKP
ncbi:MAG: DUF4350 domain-containing protein [Candidatus Obscuribacterales bacterium]|nr:DUF4350 domain-containing protein [Candidatus Obscuribacterales bacterium]